MNKLLKISIGFTAFFMLVPGLAKLTDKFGSFFTRQIDLANLPFPVLSFWGGLLSEILFGLILFGFLFFSKKCKYKNMKETYIITNLGVAVMMLVALYVHLHPEVPAEILPFEEKAPVLTVTVLVAVVYNLLNFREAVGLGNSARVSS